MSNEHVTSWSGRLTSCERNLYMGLSIQMVREGRNDKIVTYYRDHACKRELSTSVWEDVIC